MAPGSLIFEDAQAIGFRASMKVIGSPRSSRAVTSSTVRRDAFWTATGHHTPQLCAAAHRITGRATQLRMRARAVRGPVARTRLCRVGMTFSDSDGRVTKQNPASIACRARTPGKSARARISLTPPIRPTGSFWRAQYQTRQATRTSLPKQGPTGDSQGQCRTRLRAPSRRMTRVRPRPRPPPTTSERAVVDAWSRSRQGPPRPRRAARSHSRAPPRTTTTFELRKVPGRCEAS